MVSFFLWVSSSLCFFSSLQDFLGSHINVQGHFQPLIGMWSGGLFILRSLWGKSPVLFGVLLVLLVASGGDTLILFVLGACWSLVSSHRRFLPPLLGGVPPSLFSSLSWRLSNINLSSPMSSHHHSSPSSSIFWLWLVLSCPSAPSAPTCPGWGSPGSCSTSDCSFGPPLSPPVGRVEAAPIP